MSIHEFLSLPMFENSIVAWLLALSVVAALMSGLLLLRRLVRRHHQRLLDREGERLLEVPFEVLSRTTLVFFVVLSIVMGLKTLTVSERTADFLTSLLAVALLWQAGVWLSAAVVGWLERKRRRSLASDRALASSLGIIGLVARTLIWALILLLTLDNLGVDITALVAGLGIGGIAVALAVQNILGDLFASLSITLDRPFVVGDFLIVGDFLGTVEYIGIKSTRLRSLSGEQIIMSNADLLGSRVRNFGRMAERRVVFTLNVTYETPADALERIPCVIRQIIEAQEGTRFDRSHFASYGVHSLVFETVYYVLSADYNRYMNIQQTINLRIFREFAHMDIHFAYPTQKVYFAQTGPVFEGGHSSPDRAAAA
ncbi:MAG TPA: mechanosensitive ion channel family protein [Steroidobacteraceae bacterium]|nr:mechanosensitive ion channel family protein [Steroidobacteraceae bacterium]